MGSSQSTRKIGIDNEESVGVIRVSENVANRLKNVNNGGNNNSQYSSSQIPINQPNLTYQQPPAGGFSPQPFITSTMIREEIEKELIKNDLYWERRIKNLHDNQNRISHIMEAEFNKAYKEVESNFSVIAPKNAVLPCQDYKSMVVNCFKNNANHTLNCSKVVDEFTLCISNSRSSGHNENRSP